MSSVAKQRKLEPRPSSVLCKAHIQQNVWVICQQCQVGPGAGDWLLCTVRKPLGHRVHGPVLELDEVPMNPTNRNLTAYIDGRDQYQCEIFEYVGRNQFQCEITENKNGVTERELK